MINDYESVRENILAVACRDTAYQSAVTCCAQLVEAYAEVDPLHEMLEHIKLNLA